MAIPDNAIYKFKAFLAEFVTKSREDFIEETKGPFLLVSGEEGPPLLIDLGIVLEFGVRAVEFGRGSECGVVCTNQDISTRHARFEVERRRWTIQDLGSTNGTFATERLTPNYPKFLENGLKIRLGRNLVLQFWEKTRLFEEIRSRRQRKRQSRVINQQTASSVTADSGRRRTSRKIMPITNKLSRSLFKFAEETKRLELPEFIQQFRCPFLILLVASKSRNIAVGDDTIDATELARHRGLANLQYWLVGSALRHADLTFGRSENCDLILDHHTVSKMHAVLEFDDQNESWNIRNLDSHNGLWVDGQQVEKVQLKDELIFRLGIETEFQFMEPKTFHDFARLYRRSQIG